MLIPLPRRADSDFLRHTCGGGQVEVKKTVTIETIDHPLDPAWEMLAGTTSEGKSWTWNDVYPDGSWGCWRRRGYGWSNLGPNWDCIGIGDSNGPATVDPAEYITFDLNGGAIAHLPPRADGTEVKGTFTFTIGTTPPRRQGRAGSAHWSCTAPTYRAPYICILRPVAYVRQVRHRTVHRQRADTHRTRPGRALLRPRMGFVLPHWCFKAR